MTLQPRWLQWLIKVKRVIKDIFYKDIFTAA
jgi:hypothetical protein